MALTPQARGQEDLVKRALADLQAGDPGAAFTRLAPEEQRHAGDVNYDLLLGLSALAIGRNTEAVFALERVLAQRPDDFAARVAMGRAHLALQETQAARREFHHAESLRPTPETQAIIQRYLTAVDQVEAAGKFSARLYLEFAMGYDSNVNSASSVDQIAIPALGGLNFTIASSSQARKDGFLSFAGGLSLRNRLSANTALTGSLNVSQRLHFREVDYEPSAFDASVGLTHTRGANFFSAGLQQGVLSINDPAYPSTYRESFGGTLQWVRALEGGAQWTGYYQFAALSHPTQVVRDARRHILGTAFAKSLTDGLTAYAGLYGGYEKAIDADFRYLGHDPYGARLGGDYAVSNRLGAFANASYERRRYRAQDPLFLVTRKDHQYAAAIGMNYALEKKGWKVTPQLSYIRVDSNIAINAYDRLQAMLTLRGDF